MKLLDGKLILPSCARTAAGLQVTLGWCVLQSSCKGLCLALPPEEAGASGLHGPLLPPTSPKVPCSCITAASPWQTQNYVEGKMVTPIHLRQHVVGLHPGINTRSHQAVVTTSRAPRGAAKGLPLGISITQAACEQKHISR